MTTEEKIRLLANLAGWNFAPDYPKDYFPDYPNSLDAIARDLLPILREKGMQYNLHWNGHDHGLVVWDSDGAEIGTAQYPAEPATVAFEAIFEALHGVAE